MSQEINDSNPWSEGKDTLNGTTVDTQFDDNFTQIEESNENGLQLPESEHYLAALERKLMRIQNKQGGKEGSNRSQAKEILKSLNAKRDAIFQHNLPSSDTDPSFTSNESFEKTSQMQAISNLITSTTLYGVLEKKIAPQNQALDAEEVKKLLDADLLNLMKESDPENLIWTNKATANNLNQET